MKNQAINKISGDFNESRTSRATDEQFAANAHRLQESLSSVALQGLAPIKNTAGVSAVWNSEDIHMAIRDVADMCEKTQIFFIALGDFAKAVRDHGDVGFNASKVEVGMPIRELTPEVKSLFKTWGFEETSYGYKYYFTPPIKWDIHIPVEIHVFTRDYPFFRNPDYSWFGVDDFRIPNPFDEYWKVRGLIK